MEKMVGGREWEVRGDLYPRLMSIEHRLGEGKKIMVPFGLEN